MVGLGANEGSMNSRGISHRNNNQMARQRWRLLAHALHRRKENIIDDIISVRRFSTFGLLGLMPLKNAPDELDTPWFEYTTQIGQETFRVLIRHLIKTITPVDLMGFNNTGNICVWPSEEVLAYYALCNRDAFEGKTVLELGGGMTCLAGLLIAKYTRAMSVTLTDGNVSSVDNVCCILKRNGLEDSSRVISRVLEWGVELDTKAAKFDFILTADCLFFDDSRSDLVSTMWQLLKWNGHVLVAAPKRGDTLTQFIKQAGDSGFHSTLDRYYNDKSVQFHEGGKKHKENVAKHISAISRKSAKDFAETIEVDLEMKKMEEEAMRAYMKDIASNPDFSSQLIIEEVAARKAEREEAARQEALELVSKKKAEEAAEQLGEWLEAKSDEGHLYYWQSQSAESRWEPPDEGYVSIEEQHKREKEKTEMEEELDTIKANEENKKIKEKEEARKERDKTKKNKKRAKSETDDSTGCVIGPAAKPDPYGCWASAEQRVEEPIDLELPYQELIEIKVPALEEPKFKFKEKTVSSLAPPRIKLEPVEGGGGFKKRKIIAGARNSRQRLDAD